MLFAASNAALLLAPAPARPGAGAGANAVSDDASAGDGDNARRSLPPMASATETPATNRKIGAAHPASSW
jgi:hypothetical protein